MNKLSQKMREEIKNYIKHEPFVFASIAILIVSYAVCQFLALYFSIEPIIYGFANISQRDGFGTGSIDHLPYAIVSGVLCFVLNSVYKIVCKWQLKRADVFINKRIEAIDDQEKFEEARAIHRAFGDYIDRYCFNLNHALRAVSIAAFVVITNYYLAPFFLLYELLGFLIFYKKAKYSHLFLVGSNFMTVGYLVGSAVLIMYNKLSFIALVGYFFLLVLSHLIRNDFKMFIFHQKINRERIEKLDSLL